MDPLTIKNQAIASINDIADLQQLEEVRIQYLGKNGLINKLMAGVKNLTPEERGAFGQQANAIKQKIEETLEVKKQELQEKNVDTEWVDVTLPGKKPEVGHLHLVTQAIEDISKIFAELGFVQARYPEVEWDWFAFESLNMPKNHPARDEWETMFINVPNHEKYGKMLLTPHTSSGQIREILRLNSQPPVRMINIAKTYRRQNDVTHSLMFHQFEGLVIDKHITIADLKGTLDYFAKKFYGPSRTMRLRPFHFQFTEPSFEIDINCAVCLGEGKVNGQKCKTCKQGWLELGGAGMVHPNVLKAGGIDPEKYCGFAFGWGVERVYMMRSDVKLDDIRYLYENDIRFLEQF